MPKVRLNIELSQQLADFLEGLAGAENTTRSEMVRRAISVLQAFQQQREIGRSHLGFVKDPRRLDAEILGILQPPPPSSGGASHASAVDHTPSGGARQKAEELAQDIARFPQVCVRADRRSTIKSHGLSVRDALVQEWYNGRAALIADGVAGATRFKDGLGRHGDFATIR